MRHTPHRGILDHSGLDEDSGLDAGSGGGMSRWVDPVLRGRSIRLQRRDGGGSQWAGSNEGIEWRRWVTAPFLAAGQGACHGFITALLHWDGHRINKVVGLAKYIFIFKSFPLWHGGSLHELLCCRPSPSRIRIVRVMPRRTGQWRARVDSVLGYPSHLAVPCEPDQVSQGG